MDGQKVDTSESNFDDAFAELSALLEDETDDDAIPAPGAEAEEVLEETAEDDPKESEEGSEGSEGEGEIDAEGSEEPEAEKTPTTAAPPESQEDMLKRLADMLAETKQSAPSAQPTQQQPQATEDQLYSPDEVKFLESYEEEWGDVSKAEGLKRRAEYRQLVDYVFNEVAQQLTPLAQNLQVVSERAHLQDLQSTVGDYDVVRDQVVGWVEQQPSYLQDAYKRVITNGTVDEVADLIGRYKRESSVTAVQPEPVARKKETELPATTKKAAASLAPVSSKRSVVPQGEDPTDFEAAFASFAGKL
jgi:hypothetical protein